LSERNGSVENAVDLLLSLVDKLAAGGELEKPIPSTLADLFDSHVKGQAGSIKLACAFLVAYSVVDRKWNGKSVPVGIRGKYGDEKFATELNRRYVTFHGQIVAFGENLGWKGAVKQFDLSKDKRFAPFLAKLKILTQEDRRMLVDHVAWRIADSRTLPKALPPLPSTYLSYARSLDLCHRILDMHTEGHVQQFLVAAFLEEHRKRFGHKIVTHHPHAPDKFDRTAGDIEEFRENMLLAAYEVTVRSD